MNDWDDLLSHAFGLLLGKPLAEFDTTGTYAVFHYDDETAGDALEDVDPQELLAEVSGRSTDLGGDGFYLDRWVPDLARSVFVATSAAQAGLPVRPGHLSDDGRVVVWAKDLGRALQDGSLDREKLSPDGYRNYPYLLLRPLTDGSLLDAMRAATWTMGAPEGLSDVPSELVRQEYVTSGEQVIDPDWAPVLDQIPNDALRRHLSGLCLDGHWARSDGAFYLGPGRCPGDILPVAALPGSEVVAGWEFGEGQGSTAVVRLES